MDEIEKKTISTSALEAPDLAEQVESLRHLIGSILILLVVVSGTLTIFLLREMKNTSAQLDAFRPQATNAIAIYQKQQEPAMVEFAKRIQQVGQTHPDFAPVLVKWDPVLVAWGWKIPASTASAPSAIAPRTTNAPSKK
jgi:hypothetical protein